jgi:hypothetical protein
MGDRNVYLILGGAGLVGFQVCRAIAKKLDPRQIIIASLYEQEARISKGALQSEFPDVDWQTAHGNLFVPLDLSEMRRSQITATRENRKRVLDHIFGDFEVAFQQNALARMIVDRRPDVIVDCVNTATAISYQDVFGSTAQVQERLANIEQTPEDLADLREDIEVLMMSQGPPQLIRHLRLLFRASQEADVGVYVKVGTTGTGGMGLNIPYTHSEDRPSSKLLHKTEVAFGHTGLLFLMARTPGAPIVKEVKPAAMVGYRAVQYEAVSTPDGNIQHLFEPKRLEISDLNSLNLREATEDYEDLGELQTTVVNTGENGVFTRGEFGAITAIGQMEFVTPEEIARTVALEIRGATTGRDVISALDSTVIDPSYRAGMIRTVAMQDLAAVEENMGDHSVALGQLGPPELSKLLFEAHLIKETFGTSYDALLFDGGDIDRPMTPSEASKRITERCFDHPVCQRATSVGIPILAGDGQTLVRGPRINVPEVQSRTKVVEVKSIEQLNAYAKKGWVDLRPANMKIWQQRFHRMITARALVATEGSAAFTLETHFSQEIEIGELVAWIFNNELDGSRLN